MKKTLLCLVAALGLAAPAARAQFVDADGVYVAGNAQIVVQDGRPATFTGLNFSTEIQRDYEAILRFLNLFGIFVTFEFQSNGPGSFTFITRYSWTESGVVEEVTLAITVSSVVSYPEPNTAVISTTVGITEGDEVFDFGDLAYTETVVYVPESRILRVTGINGRTVTYRFRFAGDGEGETTPIIPARPNWLALTTFIFPIINPDDPVWSDPPYADGFLYSIASKNGERFRGVVLPSGFGNGIQISVLRRIAGKNTWVLLDGTFNSGATVDFGIPEGVMKFKIENIRPSVDLASQRPYPVGLLFGNVRTTAVRFTMRPIKKLKFPLP
jgi:hypothetical protein